MTTATPVPPTTRGALERREAKLAWGLLAPTIAIVSLVILLPLLAIFWISFKPVGLSDLRPVSTVVRESLRSRGDAVRIAPAAQTFSHHRADRPQVTQTHGLEADPEDCQQWQQDHQTH
ncbi:MAG: hypothetical protein AAF637_25475, partial [Pseudomonadota bacterium]